LLFSKANATLGKTEGLKKKKPQTPTSIKVPEEVKCYQNAMPDQFTIDPECRKVWSCPLL